MKRFALFTLGVCSALVLAGCAGSLSNPEDFTGEGLAVKEVSIIDNDGKVVLPVKQDFTMGLKNKSLEIAD